MLTPMHPDDTDYVARAQELMRQWEDNSRKDCSYAQSLLTAADIYLRLDATLKARTHAAPVSWS